MVPLLYSSFPCAAMGWYSQHWAVWPSSNSNIGGSDFWQIRMHWEHLVLNAQPAGGSIMLGGVPSMDSRDCSSSVSSLGTARKSAFVYGCLGR